ncbi:hypothetical protein JL720_16480 [Aureococcus anophagefferens]|nr:hypothetical protein JL720_16480 [Aureococcus anophagefferens]
MVKFGARFEESRLKRRWSAYAVDYERLKLLLKVAQTAHYAKPAHVKLSNFGRDASSRGLLDFVAAKRPMDAFLAAGLDGAERAALEAARQSSAVAAEGDDDEAAAARRGPLDARALRRQGRRGAGARGLPRGIWSRGKICKKRDKIFKDEAPIRDRVRAALDGRACWVPGSLDALLRDFAAAFGRVAGCAADVADCVAEAELKLLSTYRGEEAPPPVDDPAQFLRPVSSLMDLSNGLLKRTRRAALLAARRRRSAVVFLDVDGVLHAVDVQDEDVFEAKCVDQLVAIVEATGCRLALSSAGGNGPRWFYGCFTGVARPGAAAGADAEPRRGHARARDPRLAGPQLRRAGVPQWIAPTTAVGRAPGTSHDGLVGLTPMDARRAVGLLRADGRALRPGRRRVFAWPRPIQRLATLRASSPPVCAVAVDGVRSHGKMVITFTSPTAVVLEDGARVIATDLAVKIARGLPRPTDR